jgi:hypothetical protein
LGRSLHEVATDLVVTTHQDVISRWFHSNKDVDLYIWLDKKENVIKQQLSFYGQVVEWNVVEGLKTGLIIEDDEKRPTEIVQFDTHPQSKPIEQALALLNYITALPERERGKLADNFRQDLAASTRLSPEQFIERFGAYLGPEKPKEAPEGGFWAGLRRLFRRAK